MAYKQFCAYCGEGLVKIVEPASDNYSRISLRCPNKKWDKYSLRAIFKEDLHTEVLIDYEETILNFDPFTGERIKQ